MTVVIDCNILVMCITTRSPYHIIYRALTTGTFHLAVTTDILLEYHKIISQKYSTATAAAFTALLHELPNVHLITTHYHCRLITADPDDNKYCDCAVAGQADYIVTEDRHFALLETVSFPPLRTLTIDAFAK